MNVENKNSVKNEDEDTLTRKETIKENLLIARDAIYGAMGAIGLLTASMSILSPNYQSSEEDNWGRDQGVAVELAKRFNDCHVISFADTHTPPQASPRISHPEKRTTLKLQVSIDEAENIKAGEYPYSDKDRFHRNSPIVAASISPEASGLTAPNLGEAGIPLENNEFEQMAEREGTYPATLNVELHPKTNYPDGKQARIFIKTLVTTSDKPERLFQATGYRACGTMVFDGETRSWQLKSDSPSDEPVVKTELQEDPGN